MAGTIINVWAAEVLQVACGRWVFSLYPSITSSSSSFTSKFSSSSISPVTRLAALISLLLVALVTQPSTCNRDDSEVEEQVDTLSVQLSVTAQVTTTPPWAVVWGPTQPLEDETNHFLPSQETDYLHLHGSQQEVSTATPEDWIYPDLGMHPQEKAPLESRDHEEADNGGTEAEETEPEEGGHQEMRMKDFWIKVAWVDNRVSASEVLRGISCHQGESCRPTECSWLSLRRGGALNPTIQRGIGSCQNCKKRGDVSGLLFQLEAYTFNTISEKTSNLNLFFHLKTSNLMCVCYSGPSVLRHRDHLVATHPDSCCHYSQTLVGIRTPKCSLYEYINYEVAFAEY